MPLVASDGPFLIPPPKFSLKERGKLVYGPQQPRLTRRRSRTFAGPTNSYNLRSRNGVTLVEYPVNKVTQSLSPRYEQVLDTIRNPDFFTSRSELPDDGGELYLTRTYFLSQPTPYIDSGWRSHQRTERHIFSEWIANLSDNKYLYYPEVSFPLGSPVPPASDAKIDHFSVQAWHNAKPATRMVNLGVFAAELRELPSLIKQRLDAFRDVGNIYLAYQFGLKPLLSDIRSMLNFVENVDARIDFLIANNGKPVRRRTKVNETRDSYRLSLLNSPAMYNTAPRWGKPSLISAWRTTMDAKYHQEIWFSGKYIYYLGDLSRPETRAHLAAGLLGIRVTPKDFWELLPWSWLIDWFTNLGDLIENLDNSVAERQLTEHAYLMGKTRRTYTRWTTDGYYSCSTTRIYETKRRIAVSPYGLALTSDLSERQISILAALGIQRFF